MDFIYQQTKDCLESAQKMLDGREGSGIKAVGGVFLIIVRPIGPESYVKDLFRCCFCGSFDVFPLFLC